MFGENDSMKLAESPAVRCEGLFSGQTRYRLAAAAMIVAGWTTTLMAQTPAKITEESGGMVDWAVATGLAAIVCGAGFWNPKRSHQN